MSARSQDTQASSSWYTPWAWYASQPAAPTEPGDDAASGMTAAEAVKEEALARDEKPAPVPADQPRPPPPNELPNPIENTITTNLPGWASFFTSRTLAAKRVTDGEREENGMEVMDVDVEAEEEREPMLVATSEDASEPAGKQVSTQVKSAPKAEGGGRPSSKQDRPKTAPAGAAKRKSLSPAPSKASGRSSPTPTNPRPSPPNLVLPTWDDTFNTPPRSTVPAEPSSTLQKTMRFVSGVLFEGAGKGKGRARARDEEELAHFGKALPRAWSTMGERAFDPDVLRGCKRVVVIGIHGWFPGAMMRSVLGEPTGTSSKFVAMMCQALDVFQEKHDVKLDKITPIPLEGEGTIIKRVEKLYNNLTANTEWMDDLHAADAILVATHSQGSIVSTHLLDRLIQDKHIRTSRVADLLGKASAAVASGGSAILTSSPPPQRVCCLALCGIHLGPLRYLSSSSLLLPYIQYFESAAAKELFEFQSTDSEVSKSYVKALRNVLDHGTKMVYVASLNDQVVPIYSGIFTAASHPLILRALYIDGDAYHSSDFLTNLLVLLVRILNSGLSDSGLAAHLSEGTAGSLNGIGHSTAYEELETYSLAVNYLFMANQGLEEHPELVVEPFNANTEQNDYEIPWALRDLIADAHVAHLFTKAFSDLRDAFPHWHPKTTVLRDIKRKLQPIQRLNAVKHAHAKASSGLSSSKL
ncbi:hypothetical protein OF83DRAFT_1055033 [Amylostereum chailletii]|nr:hypothetical protein OF83DRAFT_1055033 [Amylostereum chailletii]